MKLMAQPMAPKPIPATYQPLNTQPGLNTAAVPAGFRHTTSLNSLQNDRPAPVHTPPPGTRQQQLQELQQVLEVEKKQLQNNTVIHFKNYLQQLLQLDPDSFSITKAVYLSEAVYYNTPYSFQDFEGAIKQRAALVQQLLQQEGLNPANNLAVHYGIQKLFSQDNTIRDRSGKSILVKRIRYDFDDYNGARDWTKMFVTKVLLSNSGQCHNLPLLYLCIAEQLHAKAYLSLAPNHSFIQFTDNHNKLHNFETTNGNLVTTAWLMQSDAINVTAIKNRTYLDTLSSRKLYAQCLADFQMAYLARNGYDDFTQQLSNQILAIDSNNINALMINANYCTQVFRHLAQAANYPPSENLYQYPQLQAAYNNMLAAQQKIATLGYQDMPEQQYRQWLKSIELEKKKQRYKDELEKQQRAIQQLKKIKSTFINTPKK
jgi:hypothetical protein